MAAQRQVEPGRIRGRLTTMTPATRSFALLACLSVAACSQTHADRNTPAATLTVPSSASPTSEPAPANPSYGLINDTSKPVSVTGCESACPRTSLAPGTELDFSLGYGRVTVHFADGKTTCLQVINGIVATTPQPRQILRISKNTSASAC
jgi:hypothetical protein